MNAQHASDEVTDLIASIEMHRQEIERESGLDASRNYALPRLQDLLKTEQDASQQPGAEGPHHAANIEAVNAAIRKLQSLGRGGGGVASSAAAPAENRRVSSAARAAKAVARPASRAVVRATASQGIAAAGSRRVAVAVAVGAVGVVVVAVAAAVGAASGSLEFL